MDIHFPFASKRHNEAAHSLLSELSFIQRVSDNQVIPWHPFNVLLRELLKDLAFLELTNVERDHCLILQHLDFLSEFSFVERLLR